MMSYLHLLGKVALAPGHLSGGSHSELKAEAKALILPNQRVDHGGTRCML